MYRRAFTLIELLVVIAIMGILSTIVVTSLSSAKAKGRDVRRLSDIKTIEGALALYYADNFKYPTVIYGSGGLVPNYMPVMPVDPSYASVACTNGLQSSCYKYGALSATGANCNANAPVRYHLGAAMESDNTQNSNLNQDVDAVAVPSGYYFCSQSPTAGNFDGRAAACAGASAAANDDCYDVSS